MYVNPNVYSNPTGNIGNAAPVDLNALFVSPEALMAYCRTQITGIDGQVKDYFEKQQKNAAAQQALNKIQSSLPARDENGDINPLTDEKKVELKLEFDAAKQAYQDAGLPTDTLDDLEKKFTATGGAPGSDSIISAEELTKCDQQFKSLQSDLGTSSQLDMISLQELMSRRQAAIQLTTNLVSTFNDTAKSVIGNIK